MILKKLIHNIIHNTIHKIFVFLVLSVFTFISVYAQTFYSSHIKGEQLIYKDYITISYSIEHNVPNYVGEHLTSSITFGNVQRCSYFYRDNAPVSTKMYNNIGFDRGHMAPAADFKGCVVGMKESFSMFNVAPQRPRLNRVCWEELEEYIRRQLIVCDEIYVVTGTLIANQPEKIGIISIPSAFYKAYIGIKDNKKIRSCAWIYYNTDLEQSIKDCEMTIDELEKLIGQNLFPTLNKYDRKTESKILK